jgi:hypothetical protein
VANSCDATASQKPSLFQFLIRVAVQVLLGLQAVAATAWWWASPGGFPIGHLKFWANAVVPVVIVLAVGFALWSLWTKKQQRISAALAAFAVFSLVGVTTTAILFPHSARRLMLAGVSLVVVQTAFAAHSLCKRPLHWKLLVCGNCMAAMSAAVLVFAQQGPPPETHPLNPTMPALNGVSKTNGRSRIELAQHTTVDSARATVDVHCGKLRIECQPLLTFHDYSPDRCWSILRPRDVPLIAAHKLSVVDRSTNLLGLAYGANAALLVDATDADVLQVEAFCRLQEPVYSHLNTFCELSITGHSRLFLKLSPCADERIEVLPADYPTGRPARMAFVTSDGEFRVVEASDGEKGPFRKLAAGRVDRQTPLTITLSDGEDDVCRIVFDDWVSQAATQLSPTAGWRLPVNAIEFQRHGDNATAPVTIWLTLAATSVGRGWDTVGHAAGVYRNRMRIERIAN